ncbi:periplasmic murein peptide-binding protein [Escherichia coli]|nr:periplasmic murein peptide-binding protein [Escherichia coli]
MKHSVSVTCCALLVSSILFRMLQKFRAAQYWQRSRSWCATLKMSLRRWIPAKAVGLPEIQVIRDLFEGLVNQNEKGRLSPGVATQWKVIDNRIWTFTLRR